MEEPIVKSKELSTPIASGVVEFFDPPMCCPTGLCGPTVNETLLDLSEAIRMLEREAVKVVRYQMANHPHAFLGNPEVMRLVREQQMAALPISVVNAEVVKVGAYPSLSEIRRFLEEDRG